MEGEDLGRYQNQIKRNNAEIVNGKTTWPRYGDMEPRLQPCATMGTTRARTVVPNQGTFTGTSGTSPDRGKVWHNKHSGGHQDDHWSRYRGGQDAHSHHQSGGWGQTRDGCPLTGEGEVLLHQQKDGGAMTMANGSGGNDRTRLIPPPLQFWMTGENQNTLTSCNAGEAHPPDQPEPIPVIFTR